MVACLAVAEPCMQALSSISLFCRSCLTATWTGMSVIPLMGVAKASGPLRPPLVRLLATAPHWPLVGMLPLVSGAVARSKVTTTAPPPFRYAVTEDAFGGGGEIADAGSVVDAEDLAVVVVDVELALDPQPPRSSAPPRPKSTTHLLRWRLGEGDVADIVITPG